MIHSRGNKFKGLYPTTTINDILILSIISVWVLCMELFNLLLVLTIMFSFAGLYFVVRIWFVWGEVDKAVLKARAFLNDKFLIKNWLYAFLTGAFFVAHTVINLIATTDPPIEDIAQWPIQIIDISW